MELTLLIAVVVALAVIALEGVLLYLLLRQHGLTLLGQDDLRNRLTSLEQAVSGLGNELRAPAAPQIAAPREPLPIGAPAPDFALPGLDGTTHHLRDFLGKQLVLVFFNPDCGFCAEMAPAIGRLPDEAAPVLLVSRGNPDEHRRMAQENGWRCDVVLEPAWDVAMAYRTQATPTGYLLDSHGRIASELTVGANPLLALAESARANGDGSVLDAQREKQAAATERARAAGLPVRDIGQSRINRDGLPAGTTAPDFELPDLTGETRSLAGFRGVRVLLVFSDPDCGPCEALTPSLVRLHALHRENGLQVLVVSKGDPEKNRQKAREQGVDFPVLLQRGSEVAKKYGTFATPVGYLINEHGALSGDLAIGADAIVALVA